MLQRGRQQEGEKGESGVENGVKEEKTRDRSRGGGESQKEEKKRNAFIRSTMGKVAVAAACTLRGEGLKSESARGRIGIV